MRDAEAACGVRGGGVRVVLEVVSSAEAMWQACRKVKAAQWWAYCIYRAERARNTGKWFDSMPLLKQPSSIYGLCE